MTQLDILGIEIPLKFSGSYQRDQQMASSSVTLQVENDLSFKAYVARPDQPNGATIVVLQEIFGVNANMRTVADDLAAIGFVAIVPDLFWRQDPGVQLDPMSDGDRTRATELMKGLDMALAVQDALTAARYVRGLQGTNGSTGAVGYCLGGKLAYLLSMQPGVDAAVSYYGVAIQGALSLIADVRCPVLLHVAENDHLCPPEAQDAIARAAGRHADRVELMRYPGVGHAFARRGSPSYVQASADVANQATRDFLIAKLINAG
jgi:carboxymethylenebutenolidase